MLRSNVTDWSPEELWRAYMQLTEAEAAFRIQKTNLQLRPISRAIGTCGGYPVSELCGARRGGRVGGNIAAKHYGSREAMLDAGKKRNEMREVVASKLACEVMPN